MDGDMRQELSGIRTEMRGMRRGMDDLKSMFRRTMVVVANLTGDLGEVKHTLKTEVATKDDVSLILKRMDGLSGKVDDMRYDWAKHTTRLDDHERRIGRFETRRA